MFLNKNALRYQYLTDILGVDENDLIRIFEPMFQGNRNHNYNNGSTGIGLSIVAAIVKLHGGTVKADNISKQGLRITMVLP